MDGEVEVGELGVIGRGLERALQLEERSRVCGAFGALRLFLGLLLLGPARRPRRLGAGAALAMRTMMVPS